MTFKKFWEQYMYEGGRSHFNIEANEESARAGWEAATKACAEICRNVREQDVCGVDNSYLEGRQMGATVCMNAILRINEQS